MLNLARARAAVRRIFQAPLRQGDQIEVLLHRGMADEWQRATVATPGGTVIRIESSNHYANHYADRDEIADWRPLP